MSTANGSTRRVLTVAHTLRIYEGTSEIQKLVIAGQLLKEGRY